MKPSSAASAAETTIFLSGPPGTGKTSIGTKRLFHLLEAGVPPEQILVLIPHRILAAPYHEAVASDQYPAGAEVDIATIGGLARRCIDLFWPLVARAAGFAATSLRPRFLTVETAQYFMGRVLEPYLKTGAFDGVTISRTRLISQVIDNLNKAAAMNFAVDQIAERLGRAWAGESARRRLFAQVQAAAVDFRGLCLAEDLLDWSLQIELFAQHLLPLTQVRRYLLSGYRHLIVDNVEEDIPVTHDLLRTWLPLADSALVVYDMDGGHRVFLGADPLGAHSLAQLCRERVETQRSHVTSPEVAALGRQLSGVLHHDKAAASLARHALVLPTLAIRFHPQMLDWVAEQISHLVSNQATRPSEIAILAPFVGDALRFSIEERLTRYSISVKTHRPSRQLREEPVVRCLLTLSKLAHPAWQRPPPPEDVAQALTRAIGDLDPIRASLLATHAYSRSSTTSMLLPFAHLALAVQERIGYVLGGRYSELREWIEQYASSNPDESPAPAPATVRHHPLDRFLGRLFGEVLSQAGFGFHGNLAAGATAAMLVESARRFRLTLLSAFHASDVTAALGSEYTGLVEQGVVAAQYVPNWQARSTGEAVLLVPAYTFLMMNRPVRFQFWLDAGSAAWHERILQPLTHPYVLQRGWPSQAVWTDEDEVRVRDEALRRLVIGLTSRCRERVYLAHCELNERGFEQHGPLLEAVQALLRCQFGANP